MSQRGERDKAIDNVEAASAAWRPYATSALREVAVSQRELTSDDVWRVLKEHRVPDPSEPRAMGPVMLAGVRDGWIEQTERTRISDDPSTPNHSRPQRVYISQIIGEALPRWREWREPPPPPSEPVRVRPTDEGIPMVNPLGPRQFPLRRSEDGTVEIIWEVCDDCGGRYAVKAEHLRGEEHRRWLRTSQTMEGQTEIAVPPQPPIYKYTAMPVRPGFGEAVTCPRCRGLRKKAYTDGHGNFHPAETECMDPRNRKVPCTRCNGFGIVPNKGPVQTAEPE